MPVLFLIAGLRHQRVILVSKQRSIWQSLVLLNVDFFNQWFSRLVIVVVM